MTVTVKSYAYAQDRTTRTVEQTVVYTRSDDINLLAQAILRLGNLHKVLESAPSTSSVSQLTAQIEEQQAEVDRLQAIVDGYDAE
ncbi:MAG: hypothetical protein IJF49_08525 [Clostridia bacterium]|nr:hypothetical protein [Clostridia bacterium]